MAFADLASNQMVDENNAATGGFASIGPKNPATQCYTKAQALAAYNLSASAMSAYADNQLVPKSVWVNGAIYGGTLLLDIPGVGTNIPPDCPGCSIRSGYTKGAAITMRNTSSTETIKFLAATSSPPYPVIVTQGACRLMNHTSSTAAYFLTCPNDGEIIPPNSTASWLAFNKTSGGGIVVLSMERQSNIGSVITEYWTFNI